jgi:hypothetical protein
MKRKGIRLASFIRVLAQAKKTFTFIMSQNSVTPTSNAGLNRKFAMFFS